MDGCLSSFVICYHFLLTFSRVTLSFNSMCMLMHTHRISLFLAIFFLSFLSLLAWLLDSFLASIFTIFLPVIFRCPLIFFLYSFLLCFLFPHPFIHHFLTSADKIASILYIKFPYLCPCSCLSASFFTILCYTTSLVEYFSSSFFHRPVTEQARLRTARDMGALEAALAAAGISLGARESHPVIMEFRWDSFFVEFLL